MRFSNLPPIKIEEVSTNGRGVTYISDEDTPILINIYNDCYINKLNVSVCMPR